MTRSCYAKHHDGRIYSRYLADDSKPKVISEANIHEKDVKRKDITRTVIKLDVPSRTSYSPKFILARWKKLLEQSSCQALQMVAARVFRFRESL
ncbi:hypothetical protein CYMTET_12544 [Cymbomonas tetramitiformis]|uniref:Uncharacterized protein n=1 Tax=Cymbomonas tetramitiformis TaxID=36881 RepID=A0AAE0GKD9_9CHLO|nr:hypothetical protein CYMTET_12544 [Cymbomonas tetramitiformis]